MANKNIAKDGKKTRFTSENQPQSRGRKPKLYTIAKKAYNVCRALYKDSGKGSIATLKELTEKLWGKPMQETKPEDADIPTNIDHGISIDSWIKDKVK